MTEDYSEMWRTMAAPLTAYSVTCGVCGAQWVEYVQPPDDGSLRCCDCRRFEFYVAPILAAITAIKERR